MRVFLCLFQLSRSFSDASSWLTRMKKVEVPLGSEQMNQKPKASLNRTDEDKVKDEINDLKENQCRLERVCLGIMKTLFVFVVFGHQPERDVIVAKSFELSHF